MGNLKEKEKKKPEPPVKEGGLFSPTSGMKKKWQWFHLRDIVIGPGKIRIIKIDREFLSEGSGCSFDRNTTKDAADKGSRKRSQKEIDAGWDQLASILDDPVKVIGLGQNGLVGLAGWIDDHRVIFVDVENESSPLNGRAATYVFHMPYVSHMPSQIDHPYDQSFWKRKRLWESRPWQWIGRSNHVGKWFDRISDLLDDEFN
jgi:hypothetical protein